MDQTGNTSLTSDYAFIFSIDNDGIVTYTPSWTGLFTFYAIARTEAEIVGSRKVEIDSVFY